MNIIIYHRDLYQGFIKFITLIILSNIKENYSCSGLIPVAIRVWEVNVTIATMNIIIILSVMERVQIEI